MLRWDTACVTALSHVCFVTPSHGLGQQSWHAQSCHLAGLHHPHPATRKGGTSRDRCHRSPDSSPDKALGGTPAPGVQVQAVPEQVSSQAVPAAVRDSQGQSLSGDLWVWNPALHPGTRAQHSPRQSQYSWEGRAVLGLGHGAGTCHPLPPRLWGDREEVLLVGHEWG